MKSRMTLTSKCQLVLHFLLFTLTVLRTGVHNHTQGSLHIWTLLFVYCHFCTEQVAVGKELKRLKKKKKAWWLFLTNGWKLIIRTQPGPQPPTPFIWGAIRLIILLESLQVRAPQPALCNCHSNRTAEVALRCTLQCYAVIVRARQSASDEEIK